MFKAASNAEIMQTVLETMRIALPKYENSRGDLLNIADGLHKALSDSDQREMGEILSHLVNNR